MKVKLLEPIEGFEDVAEYRVPASGEHYVNAINGSVETAGLGSDLKRIVLTPIKRWRPATIDDAIRAIKGETVVARFRSHESHEWEEDYLAGAVLRDFGMSWIPKSSRPVKFCEVLDA